MAAKHTLSHLCAIPQISKSGVLTLYGYGVRVTMQAGHLQIEDGIGPERRKVRLPRVNHRLKRLVCIAGDGFITLAALTWLTDIDASFVVLNRFGKVRMVTGPASPSESKLRRAQALALGDGKAVEVSRQLISAKLSGQEALAREKLHNVTAADSIGRLKATLDNANRVDDIRTIESRAAATYWNAWRNIPVLFTRKETSRVPAHWLSFDTRHSPLTGGPRWSVNPVNSLLNYTNAIAESECRLAAIACGLDPGLGFLHTDTANRDSLALDLIEPIRPAIEAWILNWLLTEPLRRSDFSEGPDGNCRLSAILCSKLAETAPTWARLVAPWAEYVAHALASRRNSAPSEVRSLRTPLTQTHRRDAKGAAAPKLKMPKTEHVCPGCGKAIGLGSETCGTCAIDSAKVRFVEVAKLGRLASKRPESRAKHSRSARQNALAYWSWNPSNNPEWLTKEFFLAKIQPLLAKIPAATICSLTGFSRHYVGQIRKGYCPHPRHWKSLSNLVGLNLD